MPTQFHRRNHRYFEEIALVVPHNEPRVLYGYDQTFDLKGPFSDAIRTVKALRVDAIIPGNGEDVARGFANILAGLKATILVGQKHIIEVTFVRGVLRAGGEVELPPPDSLPHIQHGVCGPLPAYVVVGAESTEGLAVRVVYDGPRQTVSFLRVLLLGTATERVQ